MAGTRYNPKWASLKIGSKEKLKGEPKGLRKESLDPVAAYYRKIKLWFNFAIRMRDTRVDGDGNRWGRCISCGKLKPFEHIQAGHFIPEPHQATRFHEKNVHGQCDGCNKWKSGNVAEYRKAIVKLYGEDEVAKMEAMRFSGRKLTLWEAKAKCEEVIAWATKNGWHRKARAGEV